MLTLENLFYVYGVFLKCLSSWPLPPKASNIQKTRNLVHFLLVIIVAFSMFLQIFMYTVQNHDSAQSITEHIITQVAFLQLTTKVALYRINREGFSRLLKKINIMVKNGSCELKTHFQAYARIGNIIYLTYTFMMFLLIVDYFLKPFIKAEYLPVAAWYPFDYDRSTFLHSAAYFHQICLLTMCWLSTGTDVMFGLLVFTCCAQYKVIHGMLKRLNKPGEDQISTRPGSIIGSKDSAKKLDDKIAEVVDLHTEVFESINDINNMHTYIVFVLFLTSAIMICCAALQITNKLEQSLNSQIIFSGIVCCLLLQLLFYFLPGDMVANEAKAVGIAAYYSDWESMSPRCRKFILLIMLRSDTPPKLQGARVKPIVLRNYASFLATTASYFTSLQAITGID